MSSERSKFDLQLEQADVRENHLAYRLSSQAGGKIEVKSERYLWERTGNICIEYRCRGQLSGIATTEADWWAHELIDGDENVVVTLLVPTSRLKQLCRENARKGLVRKGVGDDGESDVVLVRLEQLVADLLRSKGS